jgi:hypothetical protein
MTRRTRFVFTTRNAQYEHKGAPWLLLHSPLTRSHALHSSISVRNAVPAIEWPSFAGDIAAILDLKGP